MNRYEIAASHSTQDGMQDWGVYTIHASSPRVALQRVMSRIRPLDIPVKAGRGVSLRLDVVNRGKVQAIAPVEWLDCHTNMVVTIDGQQFYTHDDNGGCQVEYKHYGYQMEYIPADSRIPEGWGVYKQHEPSTYRFKPTARLAVLMAR